MRIDKKIYNFRKIDDQGRMSGEDERGSKDPGEDIHDPEGAGILRVRLPYEPGRKGRQLAGVVLVGGERLGQQNARSAACAGRSVGIISSI